MATISAAVATVVAARPSQALGLPQLRVTRAERLRCGYSKDCKEQEAATPVVVKGVPLLATASAAVTAAAAASPALALVDERMSTEGTGLSNNLLGWILLGVFGLIWSLYTVYSSTLDDDDESGGLSL